MQILSVNLADGKDGIRLVANVTLLVKSLGSLFGKSLEQQRDFIVWVNMSSGLRMMPLDKTNRIPYMPFGPQISLGISLT